MDLSTNYQDIALYLSSLKELTDAVKASNEKNIWWDIAIPLGLAGVVAGLTAFITYLFTMRLNNKAIAANKRQQEEHYKNTLLIERENMNREAINEILLLINSCLTSLIAIKDNYRERLNSSIGQRIITVPVFKATKFEEISYPVLRRLFFITPNEGEEIHKWGQVTQIESLLSNYNSLMSLWQERNSMRQTYQTTLISASVNANEVGNLDFVSKYIHLSDIQNIIQLTEYCLSLTDDICKELDDFITNFRAAYRFKLNKSISNDLLIRLFNFSEAENAKRRPLFAPGPPPNFQEIRDKFTSDAEFEMFKNCCKSVYTQNTASQ